MKKAISLWILCALLTVNVCLFVGCNTPDAPAPVQTEEHTTESPVATAPEQKNPETTPPAAETVPPVDTSPSNEQETEAPDPADDNNGLAIIIMETIEELCVPERVHNITTATYVGYEVNEHDNLILTFNTVKNYLGLDMESQFKVIYYPDDIFSTNPADIVFKEGETYLLLLHRYRNVYFDGGDQFQIATGGRLLIPTDDFRASTMYGLPLDRHVTGMKITANTTLDDFIAYVKGLCVDHPPYTGQNYIQSTAREDIMTASPHVVTITTVSVTSSQSILTKTISCRIDSVQKGSLVAGKYIDIMFPLDADVGLNETMIVTLNDPMKTGLNWYMFSCKNAMYPVSEADSIMAIINDAVDAE